jgi:hypothetical protein
MKRWLRVATLIVFAGLNVQADKGHIWPHAVALAEASQRGIILHNGAEELLILGIELQAQQETEILEFIPFPSEPQVSLAQGDPFGQIQALITQKGLEIEHPHPTKGPSSTAPVELRFNAKIGLHDVAVLKLQDAKGLSDWVETFFREKGVEERPDLAQAARVADDYLQRGFHYFVFDNVPVGKETRFVEPLAYRFKTEHIYYPLKTSNLVGGKGVVDLIMLLPGSFTFAAPPQGKPWWLALPKGTPGDRFPWALSSSAKVFPGEVKAIYPEAEAFFRPVRKLYMQMLRFVGDYQFENDVLLDPRETVPYAYKLPSYESQLTHKVDLFEKFTAEEITDYFEANPTSPLRPSGP